MSDLAASGAASRALRALPARPNLEFERKRAKKLVRERAGAITLAEAQREIAREYGFASWRQLLAYYDTWDRHYRSGPVLGWDLNGKPAAVARILKELDDRRQMATQPPDVYGTAAAAATFVPRCFGKTDAEIFASSLTESEVQLIVARRARFASWDALLEHVAQRRELASSVRATPSGTHPPQSGPITLATLAAGESDYERIVHLFTTDPQMSAVHNPAVAYDAQHDHFHWWLVLHALTSDTSHARHATTWLRDRGINLQPHLDRALLGHMLLGTSAEYVRGLLRLGANPEWRPKNGYSVLEHAIALYRNGDAIDVLATQVTPRTSFWIAAGLGDVDTLIRFIDRRGRLLPAARRDRLDMTAFDGLVRTWTGRPDATDHDIMYEAAMVATMNGRVGVLEALIDRGFPVDHSPVGITMLHFSVEQKQPAVAAMLLQRGADPDIRISPLVSTPREIAEDMNPTSPADSADLRQLFSSHPRQGVYHDR